MNKQRRQTLQVLLDNLVIICNDLELMKEEEETAFDAMPERFQNGTTGKRMQDIISDLEDALESVNSAQDSILSAIE